MMDLNFAEMYRQQRDILHKASRQVVEFCQANDVKSIAVGDVRDVQDGVNLSTNSNQKISQWPHGQFVKYIAYKSAEQGMKTDYIPEDYSTRSCSWCRRVAKRAPRGRVYACPRCGAVIHRDANGASNICSRARYGSYGFVQVQTIMYLRPICLRATHRQIGRSRAFDTGQRCGAIGVKPHTV
jgi:putative transposase